MCRVGQFGVMLENDIVCSVTVVMCGVWDKYSVWSVGQSGSVYRV